MNPTLSEIERGMVASPPRRWLVTGAAGFIGSHLIEVLLRSGQEVTGIDNLSNGRLTNLDQVRLTVGATNWARFTFLEKSVCDIFECKTLPPFDFILHQAALGSVPRSIADPVATHTANVTGTLQMLKFAESTGVAKFVFASSSSVYGDWAQLPQTEDRLGVPQSPYAVSKRSAELYALNFAKVFKLPVVGLRYFNVFGPRQRTDGPYSAVIPRWIDTLMSHQRPTIFGDGTTSRDFCFVINVVKANLLAALAGPLAEEEPIFNITMGGTTSLTELYRLIALNLDDTMGLKVSDPKFEPVRKGDIGRSLASIDKARKLLGYEPEISVHEGLRRTVEWYAKERRVELQGTSGLVL